MGLTSGGPPAKIVGSLRFYLHAEKLRDLYWSLRVVKIVESRKRWLDGEEKECIQNFGGKTTW